MLIGGWSLLGTGEHEMLDKRATHRDRKPSDCFNNLEVTPNDSRMTIVKAYCFGTVF
jgi:hypothetical protein